MAAAERALSAPVSLNAAHDLSGFDCGEPALNDWLKRRALKNESRFSRTYVVCNAAKVVAFVSILAGSVERASAPSGVRRNAPDKIPVAIIGRLAVDKTSAGKGLGADLLADALQRIAMASQSIGIAAVLVQAKDEKAKQFYLKHAEFIEFPADSRILYLPVDTLLKSFG